ncbi:AsmA family protein [Nitritalea halalkaliphila]|uniref:hypothetical protein n=1 Tax=Nitritalea halalkaliphila TaxID=590849 RepID=UPI0012E9F000|nr:hypothetical protein [Nitritalea halalkaliphila]
MILLVVGLLLFIRTPYGQNFIVGKALAYLRQQTDSRWELERLFITFQGDLALEGLLVGDAQGDTLLYVGKLETGFALWPFLRTGALGVSGVDMQQVRARISRDADENFNFDFILSALLGEEEGAPAPKPAEAPASPTDTESAEEAAGLGTLYIGPVQLKDIQLAFRDESLGIDLDAAWEDFRMKTEKLDLDAGAYLLEAIDWEGLQVRYEQFLPFPPSEEETTPTAGPLPVVSLGRLRMPNAHFHYSDIPSALVADLGWDQFVFELPELDLEEQNVQINTLRFNGLRAAVELDTSLEIPTQEEEGEDRPADSSSEEDADDQVFSWPDWRVNFADFSVEDGRFLFHDRAGTAEVLPYIDPNAVELADFNLALRQITLKPGRLKAHLHTFNFREQRGLQLDELSLALSLEEEALEIADFRFQLPGTGLKAESQLRFPSIESLLGEDPLGALRYALQLEAKTDFQQLAFFAPELAEEPWFQALKPFEGSFSLSGDAESLQLSRLEMSIPQTLSLRVPELRVAQFMDPEKLRLDLPELRFTGYGRGLGALADWQGGPLPERFTVQLSSQGGLRGLRSQLALRSPIGDVSWQVEGGQRANATYFLKTDLRIRELNVADLLELPELAPLSTRLQAEGAFSTLEDLQASVRWDFDRLAYDSLDLSALRLQLAVENGQGDLQLRHARDWFDLDVQADISLDSLAQQIALQLDLQRLDGQVLGLSDTPLEAQLALRLGVRYEAETLDFGLKLERASLVQEGRRLEMGDFNLTGLYASDFIKANIRSDFLNGATTWKGTRAT